MGQGQVLGCSTFSFDSPKRAYIAAIGDAWKLLNSSDTLTSVVWACGRVAVPERTAQHMVSHPRASRSVPCVGSA